MKWFKKGIISTSCTLILTSHAFAVTQSTSLNSSSTHGTTGSKQEALDIATQTGTSYLNNIFNATNRPAWLTRTDITYAIAHNNTPVGGIETIQPLYDDFGRTLFWQGRASYNDGSATLNIGLGYRYLTMDKQFMWGVNTFFDENARYLHKRLGFGGEIFTPFVTFRANYYDAITGQKNVGGNNFERALDGFDAGIETPVPYISWMRFTAKGYHWDGVKTSDVNGGLANLRIFPARQVEIDVGVADDNRDHGQAFLKVDYYFGSPAFIEYSATTPHPTGVFAAQDLEKMHLQKVIRHNEIVVEKTQGVVTSAIIVARGN